MALLNTYEKLVASSQQASKLANLISQREEAEAGMKETVKALKDGIAGLDRDIADLVAVIRDGETLPLFSAFASDSDDPTPQ